VVKRGSSRRQWLSCVFGKGDSGLRRHLPPCDTALLRDRARCAGGVWSRPAIATAADLRAGVAMCWASATGRTCELRALGGTRPMSPPPAAGRRARRDCGWPGLAMCGSPWVVPPRAAGLPVPTSARRGSAVGNTVGFVGVWSYTRDFRIVIGWLASPSSSGQIPHGTVRGTVYFYRGRPASADIPAYDP